MPCARRAARESEKRGGNGPARLHADSPLAGHRRARGRAHLGGLGRLGLERGGEHLQAARRGVEQHAAIVASAVGEAARTMAVEDEGAGAGAGVGASAAAAAAASRVRCRRAKERARGVEQRRVGGRRRSSSCCCSAGQGERARTHLARRGRGRGRGHDGRGRGGGRVYVHGGGGGGGARTRRTGEAQCSSAWHCGRCRAGRQLVCACLCARAMDVPELCSAPASESSFLRLPSHFLFPNLTCGKHATQRPRCARQSYRRREQG